MKLHYVIAAAVLSILTMPAGAQSVVLLPDATVIPSPPPNTGLSYQYTLTTDPSLGAFAGTVETENGDNAAGGGFVTLNYYYAVVGPAINAGTYVPVTITGNVTAMAGGVAGEAEAAINYANGGVNTENYGTGELIAYGYSYVTPQGISENLNTTFDAISSTSNNPTALGITLFVDVNAATGGMRLGTSSATAGADPILSLSPALLAEGYSIELSPNLTPVPLPSTWWTLLSACFGLGLLAHRGTRLRQA